MLKSRLSPAESATVYTIGTVKKGNDGYLWTVVKTVTGIHKWVHYHHSDNKFDTHGAIMQFRMPFIKIKHVGFFTSTGPVIAASLLYKPHKISGFNKGIYYVYELDDCLAISHNRIYKKTLTNALWKNIKINTYVDYGMFGFWDLKYIQTLEKVLPKKKQTRKAMFSKVPAMINYKYPNNKRTIFITVRDLDNAELYTQQNHDEKTIVGVLRSTGTGAGNFDCFTDQNREILLLLGGASQTKILDTAHQKLPANLLLIKNIKNPNIDHS